MIYLYILKSLYDLKYYIGITKNINTRLKKHNRGEVYSTRNRKPFILVYKEEYETYTLARKREMEIKSYKGGNSFKELLK